jgi:hypothetical protein
MKRDRLREILEDADEWYALARTPTPCRIFREVVDESDPTEGSYPALTDSRPALLEMSLDIRSIVLKFLDELTRRHGSRRTDRLIIWVQEGYISRFSREHRCQIKEDSKRLKNAIRTRYYL